MKRIFSGNFLIISLILLLLSLNNFALAECDSIGKPVGSKCNFENCLEGHECTTDVCLNGLCVECANDSDCQDNKKCIDNKCQ